MLLFLLKIFASALVIALVSEMSRKNTWVAALVVSLPLTTVLSMVWIHLDTGNLDTSARLSGQVVWMVMPTLFFLALFPWLVRWGLGFWPALAVDSVLMAGVYWGYVAVLRKAGVMLEG
ncbi:MAG: DUF3147 family protein [Deltaproteobacteria bacterium]|nr:DUF3147 family protein [Deltaproteobacteria bacterium]